MPSKGIPQQLQEFDRFIRLKSGSKAPAMSPEGPFYKASESDLQEWIQNGGNVGLNLGELVALDIDSEEFERLANQHLPETFSVRSGSGGEHRYFKSQWSGRSQFTAAGDDLGSIRSGNWYLVVPPSIHPNGEPYQVLREKPIQRIPEKQIEDFIGSIQSETGEPANTAGGAAAAGRVGSSSIPSIPSEYPNREAQWSQLRNWLSENGFLSDLNKTTSSDWSGLEFKLAKCLAEGGFSEAAISNVLDRLSHKSKWNQRGSDYQKRTVRKAIQAAVDDPFIEFSGTGDMDRDRSESRKMEESGNGRTLEGGENNMPEFNDKLSVPILEASEEGDSFKKIALVEGTEDDGETFEFLSLKKGQLQEAQTPDGDSVLVENVQDSVSLGSPDYLEDLVTALEAMREELE